MWIAERSITGRKQQKNAAESLPANIAARFLPRHETALNTALMIAGMRRRSSGRANERKLCGKRSTNRHRRKTNKKQHNDIWSGLMYVDPLLLFSSGQSDHLIFYACFAINVSFWNFDSWCFSRWVDILPTHQLSVVSCQSDNLPKRLFTWQVPKLGTWYFATQLKVPNLGTFTHINQ